MFGDEKGSQGVVVKQLVPRGSAERNGKVTQPYQSEQYIALYPYGN